MLRGRGCMGAMCVVTGVLQKEIYDNLTSVATGLYKVLILESVACC